MSKGKKYLLIGEIAAVLVLVVVLIVIATGSGNKDKKTASEDKHVEMREKSVDQKEAELPGSNEAEKKQPGNFVDEATGEDNSSKDKENASAVSDASSENTEELAEVGTTSSDVSSATEASTTVPGTEASTTAPGTEASTTSSAAVGSSAVNATGSTSLNNVSFVVSSTGESLSGVLNPYAYVDPSNKKAILMSADVRCAMYDYDSAIELVKTYSGYESDSDMTSAIARYEEEKSKCVKWANNTEITHIFVHSLIVDPSRAFGPTSHQATGYNRYMTTVLEFNRMLEQMYEKGFVLISIHDIAKVTTMADGTQKLVQSPILLPPGKTPFVLSQDDVNYYDIQDNDGLGDRIVIGDNGLPLVQYTDIDGTVMYGEYDVVPIVDRFVREHPDFCYHGHKGLLGVTGYEGALGYDTGWSQWNDDNPSAAKDLPEVKALQEQVKAVAACLKADGWEFASHTYTHGHFGTIAADRVQYDTNRWKREVEPLLGPVDILIYPYGEDICNWRGYEGEKYEILKEAGFWYFCNVDSAQYWIQLRDDYMRMGRINTDGERFVKTPEKLEFMFDVDTVWDDRRPELSF